MTPEGIKQAVLLTMNQTSLELDRWREELHTLDVKVTNAAAAMQGMPVSDPVQGRTELHAAVERLFAESVDWHKSCSSTANWFAHSPAAQALKALLAQEPGKGPPTQEPRLTLGRVPAGGKGQYVVYFRPEIERPSERCFWHPEHGWQAIPQPIPAGSVIGSFGPIPYTASEVTAAWTAAGRPT